MQYILQFCRAQGHKLMKTSPIGEERWCCSDNSNNHKKLLMPWGYPHKAWRETLAATDKVSECCTQKWLNSQVFLQIFTTRSGRKVPATIVFSWLDLPLHFASYFKDIDFLVCRPRCRPYPREWVNILNTLYPPVPNW